MTLGAYIRGYVKYRVSCQAPSFLLDKLRRSIALRNAVISENNSLCFICFYGDRSKAEKIISDCMGEITSRKMRGISYILDRYKRRYGLLAGAFLSIVFVFISTLFVWHIDISGNENVSEIEIKRVLENVGFKEGVFKKSVDIDSIVNRYLIAENRVSFIAVNFDGTVARVQVKEADIPSLVEKKENVNLVADCDGIILRVDAVSGKSEVQKGETVTKGQLLVSAFNEKRTGGEILKGARGFVWAETQRCIEVYVPLEYYVKKHTSNVTFGAELDILGRSISLVNPFADKGESYDVYKVRKLENTGRKTLPFDLYTYNLRSFDFVKKRRTQKDALEIARETAEDRLYELNENYNKISSRESYETEGGVLCYKAEFTGIENIAKSLEFELS